MNKTDDDAELVAFLAMREAHFALMENFSFANARKLKDALLAFLNCTLPPDKRIEPLIHFCPPHGNDNGGTGSAA
ncbi:hypothetical protein GF108_08890 [Phyllobacterium sp. SYP-B3895]|uniref:hypothetical protein n=1 Tax=Phyllobacterium sp. SYP-B3895 TaxID=2663240 RepID=UPI001299B872|nr:hypothetical protein [Phyllobacterium sp. SYP-B3895]MRG55697.1 hypothetical protein [Phyllobacterium sp. SYP-B3895]